MSNRVPTSSPLSSLQSSADTFQTASSQSQPQYRPAAILPFELLQHVQVYLEENLFSQALRFLLNLISATTADEKKAIPVPPPDFLAVISTLTVHPSMTTRAVNQDRLTQSNIALRLLWTIKNTTGPINSCLSDAFRFRRYDDRISVRGRGFEENDDERQNKLTITYAHKDSLFNLADDFWAVVGWALNCSCLLGPYHVRWNYWVPWLEYMLDVIETDWELRDEMGTCHQSLLWQYIKTADGDNAKGRRVLRAIFADGSASSLKEFRPIFPKELNERKQGQKELKKQEVKVDVDEEIYGDWMQESDSTTDDDDTAQVNGSTDPRPSKRLRTRTPSTRRRVTPGVSKTLLTDQEDSEGSTTDSNTSNRGLGPPDSTNIRFRLIQLLSMGSAHQELMSKNSDVSWPDLHELYTLFVEFIRPLPLCTFQQFVLPSKSKGLSSEMGMALCEFLLQRMVDSEHTSRVSTFQPMTVDRLVQSYLPYASGKNTIEFQAKVSILLESLLRQLAQGRDISTDQKADVLDVLEEGIDTRRAKVKELRENLRYKKTASKDDELAASILEESSMRMRFVVQHLVN